MTEIKDTLIALTAVIVSAHVGNNRVAIGEIPKLIANVYDALVATEPPMAIEAEKPKGAVSIRASIKPEHIISMIDGKPYKTLKRHLSVHGYTPQSYREAFGLPVDYPMTASAYTNFRRDLAKKIGLGRKPAIVPPPTKALRRPRARKDTSPLDVIE